MTNLKLLRPIKFLIALESEALPIVKFFNLKPCKNVNMPYKIYANYIEKIYLLVSGMGYKKARLGVDELNHFIEKDKNCLWVNLGLAGHKIYDIGNIYEIKKVMYTKNKQSLFTNTFAHYFKSQTLLTVEREEKKYKQKFLYDMEGYGFLEALDKIAKRDNTFIFKIVSDNKRKKPENYKVFAENIIKKHLPKIKDLLFKHRYLEIKNNLDIKFILNSIKKKYHLTFYNEKKLEKLISKIIVFKKKQVILTEIATSESLSKLMENYENSLSNQILKI